MSITQQGWRAGTSSGGGGGSDEKVKISSADTTTDFLENKLVAGANITLTKVNAGGNEQIEVIASGGGGGITSLTIENTVYVSKNGNDGTGVRNDMSKPFLTIAGANTVAQAGDCVYVFSGSYSETGDTFLDQVYYNLEPNAVVTNTGTALVFDDGVTPKIIYIFGQGQLICSGGVCVNLAVSTAYIECFSMQGIGGMVLGGFCNIKVYNTITSTSVGIRLVNSASGSIKFDKLTATGGSSGILCNSNTSSELVIKGRFMSAEPNKGGGFGFSLANTGIGITKFEIDQYKQSFGSELVGSVTSGNYYFFNCVFNQATSNAGFRLDNCLVDFENCSIFQGNSSNFNMTVIGTGKVNLINCVLNSLLGVNLIMETSANVNILNSVLRTDSVNVAGGENIRILGATTTLVLANCQLLNSLPSGGAIYCLSADVPAEIYIQGTVVASLPTDTNISNQIAGTNIIVSNQTKEIPRVINP